MKERKINRAQNIADEGRFFDIIDLMYPDINNFKFDGFFKEIDTTNKTIQNVVEEIKAILTTTTI